MFAFDIGATFTIYFSKVFGLTVGLGYNYLPFKLEGEGSAGVTQTVTETIPGLPTSGLLQYDKFTGHLTGVMHYLYIKLGPSFKIKNFFINLEAVLIIHLKSTYKIDIGTLYSTFTSTYFDMPEMEGSYDEARAAAIGISLFPGYRFDIGKGLLLPVGLEFRIMLTPIAETNIEGYNLPEATIKTWYLKLKVGLEF